MMTDNEPIELMTELIEELYDIAYNLAPWDSDYSNISVDEAMVLDTKRDISTQLYALSSKYLKLFNDYLDKN